jgi:hypothetical protein
MSLINRAQLFILFETLEYGSEKKSQKKIQVTKNFLTFFKITLSNLVWTNGYGSWSDLENCLLRDILVFGILIEIVKVYKLYQKLEFSSVLNYKIFGIKWLNLIKDNIS